MSTVRARKPLTKPEPLKTVDELASAIKKAKENASEKGVSEDQFSNSLTTATHEKLKPPKKKAPSQTKTNRSCCSWLYFLFKIFWILWLFVLAFFMVTAFYRPAGFALYKALNKHMYTASRLARLVVIATRPYFEAIGLDLYSSDCLAPNPYPNENLTCPCMYIKDPVELDSTLPEDVFTLPMLNFYVIRNAVNMSSFELKDLDYFKGKLMPKHCMDMTDENRQGPQFIYEIYDHKVVERYLNKAKKPWNYEWEECPDEKNPLTYRRILPRKLFKWLPSGAEVSTNSYYVLNSQWAQTSYLAISNSFEGKRLMAMLVVHGEMRLSMEPGFPECMQECYPIRDNPKLYSGDIFVFDQVHWHFTSYTWSKYALTMTVSLTPLN